MKTHNGHFFQINKPLEWRKLGNLLRAAIRGSELWQLDQHWHGLSLQVRSLLALVDKGVATGLIALHALALSSTANRRIYAGLFLVGVVTPLASCIHLLLDKSWKVEGWYHYNNFYLFVLLGPYLSALALTFGVFLLFPKGVRRAYTLIVPAAYLIGKIIWLYQTESDQDYWTFPSWSFFAIGAVIALSIFFLFDWLCARKFHGEDRYEGRMDGIMQIADDVDAEKFKSMVMTTWREHKEFKKSF